MNTRQSTSHSLSRDLGRIAGQLIALSVRYPEAAGDIDFLLDIAETIIAEQADATPTSPAAVVIKFPERSR